MAKTMSTNANLLIIGAGLSGLSCAYHLKKDYTLYEKESKPGGMASSEVVKSFVFDKTGHLLHFQTKYVKELLSALSNGSGLIRHRRSSWVFSKKTYTRYPFQVNTYRLPPAIIRDCLLKMAEAQMGSDKKERPSNLRDWVLVHFGEGVARYFMFPYNLKLWKVPLHTLDIDWTEKFIPKASLEQAIAGAVSDCKRTFGYNKVFYYPQEGGIQSITDELLKHIRGRIFLKKEVVGISLKEKRVDFRDGESLRFKILVTTIPLPELADIIEDLPSVLKNKLRRLLYISIFNLNLGIDRPNISDKHWVYFPEKDYIFHRVGFFSNISRNAAPEGTSSLYVEVSHPGPKPPRHNKPCLKKRIIQDLKKAGILGDKDKIIAEKSYGIKYAYPIHDKKRKHIVDQARDLLKNYGIYSIGRYGSWRYMTMEECILEGNRTAEVINRS